MQGWLVASLLSSIGKTVQSFVSYHDGYTNSPTSLQGDDRACWRFHN